jgi:hypothetical protein
VYPAVVTAKKRENLVAQFAGKVSSARASSVKLSQFLQATNSYAESFKTRLSIVRFPERMRAREQQGPEFTWSSNRNGAAPK